jgi:hypothetical protein
VATSTRDLNSAGVSGHEQRCREEFREKGDLAMLWTIFVILLLLWLLGLVSGYTLSGFIWVLMALALVVFIFQILSGRRAV